MKFIHWIRNFVAKEKIRLIILSLLSALVLISGSFGYKKWANNQFFWEKSIVYELPCSLDLTSPSFPSQSLYSFVEDRGFLYAFFLDGYCRIPLPFTTDLSVKSKILPENSQSIFPSVFFDSRYLLVKTDKEEAVFYDLQEDLLLETTFLPVPTFASEESINVETSYGPLLGIPQAGRMLFYTYRPKEQLTEFKEFLFEFPQEDVFFSISGNYLLIKNQEDYYYKDLRLKQEFGLLSGNSQETLDEVSFRLNGEYWKIKEEGGVLFLGTNERIDPLWGSRGTKIQFIVSDGLFITLSLNERIVLVSAEQLVNLIQQKEESNNLFLKYYAIFKVLWFSIILFFIFFWAMKYEFYRKEG